ncbi:helix-turn-helix domain-containing protein [Kluyvera sichuanensis]|uniref:winged helix-turn-helix transcriptional regulator n=1 Tax=Kluyvera sichuanensis TaxID=2725494 RepID=UPI002FD4F05D
MPNSEVNPRNEDDLHSFFFGRTTKPLLAIASLFDALIPIASPFELKAADTFHFAPTRDDASIMLLNNGVCSVCHGESDLVKTTVFAPSVLGLIDGYGSFYDVPISPRQYIFAETVCTGYRVPLDLFVSTLDEKNLWHDVSRILAHRLIVMTIREREFVGTDSYVMVRTLLLELHSYPLEYREQINVLSFIQRRTNLSRSRIMSILSELRKGEYIAMHRGKLISVVSKLPAVF